MSTDVRIRVGDESYPVDAVRDAIVELVQVAAGFSARRLPCDLSPLYTPHLWCRRDNHTGLCNNLTYWSSRLVSEAWQELGYEWIEPIPEYFKYYQLVGLWEGRQLEARNQLIADVLFLLWGKLNDHSN